MATRFYQLGFVKRLSQDDECVLILCRITGKIVRRYTYSQMDEAEEMMYRMENRKVADAERALLVAAGCADTATPASLQLLEQALASDDSDPT